MLKTIIRISFLIATVFVTANSTMAQDDNVGIGTVTPHPAAMLHIESPITPKGVVIPFMNQIQRNALENQHPTGLPNGLLIYETDDGKFFYYQYDNPQPLNPPFGDWVEIATGAQNNTGNFPGGGIIMWSGTIASIPAGWNLCNGSNGTPDLTDKFIVSVASAVDNPGTVAEAGVFVEVQNGSATPPQKQFFKLAYIMKL